MSLVVVARNIGLDTIQVQSLAPALRLRTTYLYLGAVFGFLVGGIVAALTLAVVSLLAFTNSIALNATVWALLGIAAVVPAITFASLGRLYGETLERKHKDTPAQRRKAVMFLVYALLVLAAFLVVAVVF